MHIRKVVNSCFILLGFFSLPGLTYSTDFFPLSTADGSGYVREVASTFIENNGLMVGDDIVTGSGPCRSWLKYDISGLPKNFGSITSMQLRLTTVRATVILSNTAVYDIASLYSDPTIMSSTAAWAAMGSGTNYYTYSCPPLSVCWGNPGTYQFTLGSQAAIDFSNAVNTNANYFFISFYEEGDDNSAALFFGKEGDQTTQAMLTVNYVPFTPTPSVTPTATPVPPAFSSNTVNPSSGPTTQIFSFGVNYTDQYNLLSYINLIVDGNTYNQSQLSSSGSNYSTGVVFSKSLGGFSVGSHSYYFAASDGYTVIQTTPASFSVTVSCPGHDLSIDPINTSVSNTTPNAGDSVNILSGIKNIGSYVESSNSVNVTITGPNSYFQTYSKSIGALNQSNEWTGTAATWGIPSNATAGTYTISISAAPNCDTDLTNNTAQINVFVSSPGSTTYTDYRYQIFELSPGAVTNYSGHSVSMDCFASGSPDQYDLYVDGVQQSSLCGLNQGQVYYCESNQLVFFSVYELHSNPVTFGIAFGPSGSNSLTPYTQSCVAGNTVTYTSSSISGSGVTVWKTNSASPPQFTYGTVYTNPTFSVSGTNVIAHTSSGLAANTYPFVVDTGRNRSLGVTYDLLFGKLTVLPFYDVGISNVSVPSSVTQGQIATITNTITNYGTSVSNIAVTTNIYNSSSNLVAPFNTTASGAGNVQFNWDTSSFLPGTYSLVTNISQSQDMNASNNTYPTSGQITIIVLAPPTATPTQTPTVTNTLTSTNTPTITSTFTITNTFTSTPSPTITGTSTSTSTITNTPTQTLSPTLTGTSTNTNTITNTPTITNTLTICSFCTSTNTPSITPTNLQTSTPTMTSTFTTTGTSTPTPTPTSARADCDIVFDAFNRADTTTIGNGWVEYTAGCCGSTGDAVISSGTVYCNEPSGGAYDNISIDFTTTSSSFVIEYDYKAGSCSGGYCSDMQLEPYLLPVVSVF